MSSTELMEPKSHMETKIKSDTAKELVGIRYQNADGDLNVISFLHVLWRYRILVLASMIIASTIVVVWNYSRPNTHQGLAIVEVGRVYKKDNAGNARLELIDSPENVKTLLTSKWLLIGLRTSLGENANNLSPVKKAIGVTSELRNLESMPELYVNIVFHHANHEKELAGVTYLAKMLIDHHSQYFDSSLNNLNSDIQSKKLEIKKFQGQVRETKSRIENTKSQVQHEKEYFSNLMTQTPTLSREIADAKTKYGKMNTSDIRPTDVYFMQSNLDSQKSEYFNLNREMNDVSIRILEREKQIGDLQAQLIQLQNSTQSCQAQVDNLERFKTALQRTSIIISPQMTLEDRRYGNLMAAIIGSVLGLFLAFVFILFQENIQKIIRGK